MNLTCKEVISVYTTAINDLKAEVKELKAQVEKYQSHIDETPFPFLSYNQ